MGLASLNINCIVSGQSIFYPPYSLACFRRLLWEASLLKSSDLTIRFIYPIPMAVFTQVSDDDARMLLRDYALGDLISLKGISAGIENSNFFLTTTTGEFVLTVFEVLKAEQLPFYIELMNHLALRAIPVPQPMTRLDGKRLSIMHGKPAAIVTRLPGSYEPTPTAEHCAIAGHTLARAHLAGRDFAIQQPNLRGLSWWEQTAPTVKPFLNDTLASLLNSALDEQRALALTQDYQSLPKGPAHCDLFRDNVLFAGTRQSPVMGGFIDFYFAGVDTWIFDVAVSVNDWCIEHTTGAFQPELLQAWLNAYARVRPFTEAEHKLWPAILRAAALRFWISRLYDYYLPRPAQTLKPHDPSHFERILTQRTKAAVSALPKEF
jgi:homoserine kinase type II